MADFKPITTQEEFEALIKERLERKDKQLAEKLADHEAVVKERDALLAEKKTFEKSLGDSKKAAEKLQQDLDAEKKKSASYEMDALRTRVAIKAKIPMELKDRLKGEDEKAMEADAAELAKLIGTNSHKTPPLREAEGDSAVTARTAAQLETLRQIRGE